MKKVLVLGGTRFFGKKLVNLLLENGHDVTIATRGRTKDPFGDKVSRLSIDREDYQSLKSAVGDTNWDVVYDNICYTSKEASEACEVFSGKVKHYILTSTLSVYEFADGSRKEEDFNPNSYPIKIGTKTDFSYGEGKRLTEAVFYQKADFPVSAVRFPIVLGVDDYTKRLHFHIEQIKNGKPIGIPNLNALLSFISSDEAASFLNWLGNQQIEGPINACSKGELSLREILSIIEEAVQKQAIVEQQTDEENQSPFGVPADWYMDTAKAEAAGFQFQDLKKWFTKLVQEISN
ncbi:NAD-dependent epimerase/dehydratase family protein [Bacillus sp. Bva_UNVM-123]|uniref:NAD-dependent epimerase/dehydratase family protein n=1 Tax=Bacillus sp. Bva_UNVM-123 TaxID=2829798 RepID=UPI00391F7486